MALLSARAIVGFDEAFRFFSEGQIDIENNKREVVADLINSASEVIENAIQGPVILRQFQEYYYGNPTEITYDWYPYRRGLSDEVYAGKYLVLENRPVVVDLTHPLVVRVRATGDELSQAGTGWEAWTVDDDFIINKSRGLLTLNPAIQTVWLSGFRNVYVDYYAGWGVQTLDDELEVVTSTVPEPMKLACKKLVEHWWRNSVVEFSQTYTDNVNRRATGNVPEDVWALLRPYVNRRPWNWMIA